MPEGAAQRVGKIRSIFGGLCLQIYQSSRPSAYLPGGDDTSSIRQEMALNIAKAGFYQPIFMLLLGISLTFVVDIDKNQIKPAQVRTMMANTGYSHTAFKYPSLRLKNSPEKSHMIRIQPPKMVKGDVPMGIKKKAPQKR